MLRCRWPVVRAPRWGLGLVVALGSCAPAAPAACTRMCGAAVPLLGSCLDEWGVDWTDAGYAGPDDFAAACETWSWEMAQLEQDAVKQGVLNETGALADTCAVRARDFSAADASCETWSEVDWARAPWE